MKKIKVKVGINKSKLIKGEKRLVACGKNFWINIKEDRNENYSYLCHEYINIES